MSYRFIPGERIETGLRRIAIEEIERALADARPPSGGEEQAIHAARKRCKRLRALIRLVRPRFRDFEREDGALRDAAAGLSSSRDAAVMATTLAGLLRQLPEDQALVLEPLIGPGGSGGAQDLDPVATGESLRRFGWAMQALHGRAGGWRLETNKFKAAEEGLARTARSMGKAMAKAAATGEVEEFHRWRKHAKYHWHHLSLLRDSAPHILRSTREAAGELAETLGSHHDLGVLAASLDTLAGDRVAPADLVPLRELIAARMERIAHHAFGLGQELSAEPPSLLAARFRSYWQAVRLPRADA